MAARDPGAGEDVDKTRGPGDKKRGEERLGEELQGEGRLGEERPGNRLMERGSDRVPLSEVERRTEHSYFAFFDHFDYQEVNSKYPHLTFTICILHFELFD